MATPKELNVDIKVELNDDGTKDYLDDVKKRMRDLSPVWPKVHQSLKAYMIENFTAQGLPAGGWKPLDAEYASWKTRTFPGAPMLVQTGSLFQRIARGPKLDGGARTASFTFTGKITRFHQYGTEKMPARPILFAPERWVQEVADAIGDYIVEGNV